jgi:hypothetical protein
MTAIFSMSSAGQNSLGTGLGKLPSDCSTQALRSSGNDGDLVFYPIHFWVPIAVVVGISPRKTMNSSDIEA